MSRTGKQRIEAPAKIAGDIERGIAADIADRDEVVADLESKLDAARARIAEQDASLEARDGSLFDLKKDAASDIAVAIVNSVDEKKAKAIASGIVGWFKTRQKPAG